MLKTQDIQGIIISGYKELFYSKYLFLHICNPTKTQEWLKKIVPQITTSDWSKGKPQSAINIAFTYKGLEKLGLPADSLKTFPDIFKEGMVNRSKQLSDFGCNAPEHWEYWDAPTTAKTDSANQEIHILLILQAKEQKQLDRICKEQLHLFELNHEMQEIAIEEGYMSLNQEEKEEREVIREHFGFHDSISQPEIEGKPATKNSRNCIKAGEFILGYLNEDANFPPTPTIPANADQYDNLPLLQSNSELKDFGWNGSYLVFRKLHQDVARFRRFREKEGALMAAKIVGRWPSGVPLVVAPEQDPHASSVDNKEFNNLNNFSYMESDPYGYKCPIGAHIRRTNPRDSLVGHAPEDSLKSVNKHRIIRRGVLYGEPLPEGIFEDDGKPRGLLFICINADLRRQFEFIQQTWVNNAQFNGLYNERDPLIGNNSEQTLQQMTIQQEPICQKLSLPNFVSVKGGGYFFLPSISALYFLTGYDGNLIET